MSARGGRDSGRSVGAIEPGSRTLRTLNPSAAIAGLSDSGTAAMPFLFNWFPSGSAIAAPQPPAGSFDSAAASRGDALFSGKAKCNNCHVEPLWTDTGWNLHMPSEICIDNFQANRAPDLRYRTSPIGVLFTHSKRVLSRRTLRDLIRRRRSLQYCMSLGLTAGEKSDLIQYLLSLTFGPQQGNYPVLLELN